MAGCRHSGEGAAVKAALCREDQGPLDAAYRVAMLAGQLDGRFIGLGAGIAEEHPVGAAAGGDGRGQLFLFRDPVQVRDVLQPTQLPGQTLAQHPVTVAEGADGDAGHGIEIAAAIAGLDPHPLAADGLERKPPVGVHHRRHGSGGTRTHMPEGARF